MRRNGKFKYFLTLMFFVFIKIHDFFMGLYDSIVEENRSIAVSKGAFMLQNEMVYIVIEIILTILFYKLIIKKIANPVEMLTVGMKDITSGKLDTRLEKNTNYEFQSMVNSFNIMAKELEEAKIKADTYEQERNRLFASIAHDLKTPMTMIMGYSQALTDGTVKDEQKKYEYLNIINEQTKHTNGLLDVMFEYAKLQNEQYELKLARGDIGECLRECVARYIDPFESNDIQLDIQIPDERVECEFDSLEMSRVFFNLLSNALKHNPKGTSLYIGLSYDNEIKITIADDGTPIDDEMKSKIFSPFVVGDESRSTKGGSGLGMAVAKKIIEKHGGTIELSDGVLGYKKAFVITLRKY